MDSQKYELYANNILIVTKLSEMFWHTIVEKLTRQEQVQDNGVHFRQALVQFLQSGSAVPDQSNPDLKQGRRGTGGVLQQTPIYHPALNARGDVQLQ